MRALFPRSCNVVIVVFGGRSRACGSLVRVYPPFQIIFNNNRVRSTFGTDPRDRKTMKNVHGQKSTWAIILLLLRSVVVTFAFESFKSYSGSLVNSVKVVNRTEFTHGETLGVYVKLTVGIAGHGLNENTKIKSTSTVGLRGSECYDNPTANKDIDSDNKLVFKKVIDFFI